MDTPYAVLPGATGELVWVHWQEQTASPTRVVHPALIVHATDASLQAERIKIVPYLHAHDPLLHHMALVLWAAIEGADVAEQLYATSLADTLVVHFLRRYATSRQSLHAVTGGLVPSKLRRMIAYIKAHLEQALSLAELAAVAQTSPAHFARLFKHATGLAPHRYVITCRMEQAKRLLAATDGSLSEIGLQVGCADQSHFTTLFGSTSPRPPSLPQHHQEYVFVDAPRSVPRGQRRMELFGGVCPPHGMICARFQHFSHKCDRRRQILVVLSFTSIETF